MYIFICTVYCIVNEEPNAEEMKGRVKEYEEANKAEIVVRQSQRAEEERNVADQIMAEKREVERKKRECWEVSQGMTLAKWKMHQEAWEALLGEQEEVSEEVRAAQLQGYRNELLCARGRAPLSTTHVSSSSFTTFATSSSNFFKLLHVQLQKMNLCTLKINLPVSLPEPVAGWY